MRARMLIQWPLFLSLLITGCEIENAEEHSRTWEPSQAEFVQAVAGNSYSTSWTTDAQGTRQVSVSIGETPQQITDQQRGVNPFTFATEGLPYSLIIDGDTISEGLLLGTQTALMFDESIVEVPLMRNEGEVLLIPIEDDNYHLDNLRFGMGNDGGPTLLQANFLEGAPDESGVRNVHTLSFVD